MHITIIGLGGVGSVLAMRLGYHYDTHLIDFDRFENANAFRQPLSILYPDENKARAHASYLKDLNCHKIKEPTTTVSEDKIDKDSKLPITDIIICCVDNNAARNAIRSIALATKTPLIIAANESLDGEASMLMPEWAGTELDPWVTWPQLWDESEPEERPLHCTDPRIVLDAPQTPIANFMAAALALWLAESFLMRKQIVEVFDPIRCAFTANKLTSKRPFDLIGEKQWQKLYE